MARGPFRLLQLSVPPAPLGTVCTSQVGLGDSFAGSFRALGFAVGPAMAPGPTTHAPSGTPRSSPVPNDLVQGFPVAGCLP